MTISAAGTSEQLNANWRQALGRDDIEELLEMRDLQSWLSIGANWALVLGSMALVAWWPNPLSILLAIAVIGARQLGFAVLMHEASHRSLFRDRELNDWAGNWFCAYPVWSDLNPYRPYHLQHHARTGTAEDPDLGLITPFPITAASLRRKLLRDLSGRTGIKFASAAWRRSFGRGSDDPANATGRRAGHGFLITNILLFSVLSVAGNPLLYLLWVAAWLTTFPLVTRIRSIAEHAMTPDANDPLGNTRTTVARWWERLFIAPNRVNFHIEHHLLMTVPHYNLPRMHQLLRDRGVLDGACVESDYLKILRRAASRDGTDGGPREDSDHVGQVNGLLGQIDPQ